jgi:hypothetical protein
VFSGDPSFDGWIYFGKINQSGIQDTVDFDSIVATESLEIEVQISFCIRKKNHLITMVSIQDTKSRGYHCSIFLLILLNTQKKHC